MSYPESANMEEETKNAKTVDETNETAVAKEATAEKTTIENEEPESDFADEVKEEAKVEETVAPIEEKEPEPEINLYKDDEEEEEISESAVDVNDDNLVSIESARSAFHKEYKKQNVIKWIVTAVALVLIVLGYVIPNVVPGLKEETWTIYITLGVLLVAIIALGVYSFISRKKIDVLMSDYFAKYYTYTNAYAFNGYGVSDMSGGVADKISPEELSACNLYSDVVKVGSRDLISFSYHGDTIKLVDCAAQTRGQKNSLRTVFVGKMVVAPNKYDGEGIIVYLKGNKRALPPTNTADLSVLEDHKDYVVYGKKGNRKGLTKKALDILKTVKTDKTLVDLAVSIRPGNTYFLMGYEDNLMVLPLEKPFDPAPTVHFRNDIGKVLSVIDSLNGYKAE